MSAEVVRWTLPGWVAELILETLRMDSASPAFDPELRKQISAALQAINRTGVLPRPVQVDSGFDLFRLSKSKEVVDVCSNTLRSYNRAGLPFYHRGKAIFVSKSELAQFIMFAPYDPAEGAEEKT